MGDGRTYDQACALRAATSTTTERPTTTRSGTLFLGRFAYSPVPGTKPVYN